jgi:hypothetical protein
MAADSGNCERSRVSHPQATVSPYACSSSVHRESESRSVIFSLPALRGFSDGFVGGLIGGGVYCLIVVWLQAEELVLACLRVVVLSLVFGGFEMWRVTRGRTLKSARKILGWTLAAGMLLLWGLGMAGPKAERPDATPPTQAPSPLAPSRGSRISLPALADAVERASDCRFVITGSHQNRSKVTTSGASGAHEESS